MPRFFVGIVGLVAVLSAARPVYSHEFWIEPLDFIVADGEKVVAQNRVGQMLKGNVDPYIASTFVRFTITDSVETRDVEGRLGDRPALNVMPERDGLHIAAYQSTASTLRYRKPEKFAKFLKNEGLDWVAEAHQERGLPEANFREAYTRFGKSLIAVGDGDGEDQTLGLRLELVALTDPYADQGPVTVQLLFEGVPDPDIQLAAFRRDADGNVTRELSRTDAKGRVIIPRKDAETTLLSAVKMVEPDAALAERKNVVWHSLWASLTYGQPRTE